MIPRSEMTLRGALPVDAPTIAEIWHLGWRDGHLGYVSQELIEVRHEDSFRTRAAQRVNDTMVAEVRGQIAGFVMVVDNEVEQIYVSARHRGEGVADMLMADAERRIKDAGYSSAWLAVVAGNARARRFYERRGWSDRGLFAYAAAGEHGPIAVPSHRYVKDLVQSRTGSKGNR
jgi:ribosomal protein S18 acetylase RimI-like enzyme